MTYHDNARAEMAAFDGLPPAAREAVRCAVHPLPTATLAEALRKHRLVSPYQWAPPAMGGDG